MFSKYLLPCLRSGGRYVSFPRHQERVTEGQRGTARNALVGSDQLSVLRLSDVLVVPPRLCRASQWVRGPLGESGLRDEGESSRFQPDWRMLATNRLTLGVKWLICTGIRERRGRVDGEDYGRRRAAVCRGRRVGTARDGEREGEGDSR